MAGDLASFFKPPCTLNLGIPIDHLLPSHFSLDSYFLPLKINTIIIEDIYKQPDGLAQVVECCELHKECLWVICWPPSMSQSR